MRKFEVADSSSVRATMKDPCPLYWRLLRCSRSLRFRPAFASAPPTSRAHACRRRARYPPRAPSEMPCRGSRRRNVQLLHRNIIRNPPDGRRFQAQTTPFWRVSQSSTPCPEPRQSNFRSSRRFSYGLQRTHEKSNALRCRRDGRWPQFRDQPQDVGEQGSRNGDLGHLECPRARPVHGGTPWKGCSHLVSRNDPSNSALRMRPIS
jgi:hypothetical protein